MSREIDEKIVEMQFDNRDFEANVKTSMSTLEKLKEMLNFKKVPKGFDELSSAAKDVNLSPIGSAVESIQAKFSALEVIGVTALANITNSAINTGKQLLASLTVDNISAGWEKFGQKTTSVSTLVSQGYDLDEVNAQLERLNWFTDETSYNFTDMVAEIAKFTASGQGLEDSVSAMEGIANWAALSGQNATTASRAMYQLSQAMGKGALRYDDWKSIQNASMDTIEFRRNAADAATTLGKLKKVAQDTYAYIDENGKISEDTVSLNDLFTSDGLTKAAWLDTDVMMKTFKSYSSAVDTVYNYVQEKGGTASEAIEALGDNVDAFGLKAFKAAQEARTWVDVLDSVKDAVSTGWMNTFQNIFGDYEEAKTLWTDLANELWEVFASGGDERNEVLSEWKKLGGRDLLFINTEEETGAMWNLYYALTDILGLIKDAFREIFPPKTAQQLYDITAKFKELTENFKMSDETSQNLKNTLQGVFAVLDMVGRGVGAVIKGFKPLLGLFGDISGGLLGMTGSFGSWLTEIDKSAKELGVFETITNTIAKGVQKFVDVIKAAPGKINEFFTSLTGISVGDALGAVGQKISEAIGLIVKAVQDIGNADTSGIDNFVEKIKTRFKPLTTLFGGIANIFKSVWKALQKLSPVFGALATAVGKAFDGLATGISNAIDNADFNTLLDLINGGIMVSIMATLKKVADNLKGVTGVAKSASGILKNIKSILGGVRETLEVYQQNLQANALLKIAAAIGIITVALIALSMVDSKKLSIALGAVTSAFLDLFAAMGVFQKTLGGDGMKGASSAATSMLILSAAVLVLSDAMVKLSVLDWEDVLKGVGAIGVLMGELIISANELSKVSGKLIKVSAGLVIFGLAINELVKPVVTLGGLDIESLGKGLLGVSALIADISLFMLTTEFSKMNVSQGLGLLALAEAVKVLSDAVGKFADMDIEKMMQGLAGVTIVLGELVIFTQLTGESKKVISTATGLVILGAAMNIFAAAVEKFGQQSWEELAKGLGAMAVSLGIVVVAMEKMPKDILGKAAGLVVLGAALNIIASAVNQFSELSWDELSRGITALGGSLLIIIGALKNMEGTLKGSAALLVAAAALAIMAPVLKTLGSMNIGQVVVGLTALAGVFAVIGIAAKLLQPVVPAMLGLAGAVALIGVAVLAVGAGCMLFATGLGAIAVAGTGAAAAIVLIVEAVLSLIPQVFVKLGEAIVALCKVIADGAPALGEAVKAVILTLIDVAVSCIPALVKGALELIVQLLDALVENGPKIVKGLFEFLIQMLDALTEYGPKLVDSLITFILQIVDGLSDRMPDIMSSVVKFLDSLFSGILGAIGDIIGSFIGNVISSIANAIAEGLPKLGEHLSQFAVKLQPFLNTVSGISEDSMKGVRILAETILYITAAELLDSVSSFVSMFSGDNSSKFGDTIVSFGESMAKFADVTKNIDNRKAQGAALAAIMLADFANNLPKEGGLWQKIAGTGDLVKFGEEIEQFAPHFASYARTVSDITDTDAIVASSIAAKSLADFANNLPRHGGEWQKFIGENSLAGFAEEMKAFAPALKSYAKEVADLDGDVITKSVTAASSIRDFAANLPAHDGVWQSWVGDASLVSFAEELKSFAPALKSYANSLGDLDTTVITSSATAAMSLAQLAKNLPDQGGLVAWFAGDNTLEQFSKGLPILATAMKQYAQNLGNSFNSTAVEASAKAAQALGELERNLPDTGGIVSWFAGDNTLSAFSKGLPVLGTALHDYAVNLGTFDPAIVESSAYALTALANLEKGLSNSGGLKALVEGDNTLSLFGESISALGVDLNKFYTNIQNIKTEQLEATIQELHKLIELVEKMSKLDSANIEAFGEALKKIGETGVSDFLASFNNSSADIGAAALTLLNAFVDGIQTNQNVLNSAFKGMVDDAIKSIKDKSNDMKTTGSTMLDNLVKGLTESKAKVSTGMAEFMKEAISALKEYYKGFKDLGVQIVDNFTSGITESTKTKTADIGKAFAPIIKEITKGFNDNQKVFTEAGETVIAKFITGMSNKRTALQNELKSLIDACLTTIRNKYIEYQSAGEQTIVKFIAGVRSKETELKQAYVSLMNMCLTAIKDKYPEFQTSGETTVIRFISGVRTKDTEVSEAFVGMLEAALTAIKNKYTDFQTAGGNVVTYFVNGVKNNNSSISSQFTSMCDSAITAIRNKYQGFYDAGKYLVDGLAAGIKANKSTAINQAAAVAEEALKAAKKKLGVNSPSVEFYKVGDFAGQGLVLGLQDSERSAYYAGANMAESAMDGLRNAFSQIADTINTNIDTEPVITPVLDLTNIEDGARRIDATFSRTQAVGISAAETRNSTTTVAENQNGATAAGNVYEFNQYNYSPKALSTIEIYRQTKNQFSALKGTVTS